jgi:hypothetical protein
VQVELVTRAGCHLCDEALQELDRLGLEVLSRDVDADPELFRLYDFRVPVVLYQGRPVAEGRVDSEKLRTALKLS